MMISEAFQYPTRLGRAAKLPGGSFVFGRQSKKRHSKSYAACRLSSSASAALTVNVAVQVGNFALGRGQELLQLILERLLGRNRLSRLLCPRGSSADMQ